MENRFYNQIYNKRLKTILIFWTFLTNLSPLISYQLHFKASFDFLDKTILYTVQCRIIFLLHP